MHSFWAGRLQAFDLKKKCAPGRLGREIMGAWFKTGARRTFWKPQGRAAMIFPGWPGAAAAHPRKAQG